MTVTTTHIKDIIAESLTKSMSYEAYRTLVQNLVAEGKSTGDVQTEALSTYSMLNDKRMQRLNKTIKLSEEAIAEIKAYTGDVTWLVLTESWCGDAAQTMPVINKVAELNENITLKVVLRDDNDALMNEFLTNGGKSIPKLIAIDNTSKNVIGDWGPRPSKATKMVNDFKAKHGTLTPEFKKDLQIWYNKDKGQNTIEDLLKLI
ncbi:thiol-disulfide isomerase/thioredoxin [Kordia periserrulae]|uniref:Thiol-disulfide isomerase/thioredoxin n=1 Tax=Kordia periserrulae TaxID=701523 RepID=A0A2T6BT84_9FLAO|nr:thioredoxin family protein [Kordia periserrulae]PTX59295.1 thiol-disulfide isomerase/thioredoxin [Kordia periserrulae]